MFTKKQLWQRRDTALQQRMRLSALLFSPYFTLYFSVIAYVELAIAIAVIAGILILAQYFSDKIVLWSTGAKIVSREQFPELYDLVEAYSGQE